MSCSYCTNFAKFASYVSAIVMLSCMLKRFAYANCNVYFYYSI